MCASVFFSNDKDFFFVLYYFVLYYLELGRRYNIVRHTPRKLNSSSLFGRIFVTNGRPFVTSWIILCLLIQLTFHNLISISLESLARLDHLTRKLYHELLIHDRISTEIFRIIIPTEMKIYIILYVKIDNCGKLLRHSRSNCSLWYKYTIIRAIYCTKNTTLIASMGFAHATKPKKGLISLQRIRNLSWGWGIRHKKRDVFYCNNKSIRNKIAVQKSSECNNLCKYNGDTAFTILWQYKIQKGVPL
jgi:hypothetical protein